MAYLIFTLSAYLHTISLSLHYGFNVEHQAGKL